jgi:hypothetical protein
LTWSIDHLGSISNEIFLCVQYLTYLLVEEMNIFPTNLPIGQIAERKGKTNNILIDTCRPDRLSVNTITESINQINYIYYNNDY